MKVKIFQAQNDEDLGFPLFGRPKEEKEKPKPPDWFGQAWNPTTKQANWDLAMQVADETIGRPFSDTYFYPALAQKLASMVFAIPESGKLDPVEVFDAIMSNQDLMNVIAQEVEKIQNWTKRVFGVAGFTFGEDPWAEGQPLFRHIWGSTIGQTFAAKLIQDIARRIAETIQPMIKGPPGSYVTLGVTPESLVPTLQGALESEGGVWKAIEDAVTKMADTVPPECQPEGRLASVIQGLHQAMENRARSITIPPQAIARSSFLETPDEKFYVPLSDFGPLLANNQVWRHIIVPAWRNGKLRMQIRRLPNRDYMAYIHIADAVNVLGPLIAQDQTLPNEWKAALMADVIETLWNKGMLPVEEILAPFLWAGKPDFQSNPSDAFKRYRMDAQLFWHMIKQRVGAEALKQASAGGRFSPSNLYSAIWNAARDTILDLANNDQGLAVLTSTGDQIRVMTPLEVATAANWLTRPHVSFEKLLESLPDKPIKDVTYPKSAINYKERDKAAVQWVWWLLEAIPRELLAKPCYIEQVKDRRTGEVKEIKHGYPPESDVYQGWRRLMHGLVHPMFYWLSDSQFDSILRHIKPGETILDYFVREHQHGRNPITNPHDEMMIETYRLWQKLRDEGALDLGQPLTMPKHPAGGSGGESSPTGPLQLLR